MYWWQIILFPFALLFDVITRLRNRLYDRGIRQSTKFDTNVVSIGNLSIGGTGKTPMLNYLIDYFHAKDWKVATLSRGYGRNTRGFRLASTEDNADSIGDEPFMYYTRYKGVVPVAVGEERDLALSELYLHEPDTHVVLLDDAFQHRRLLPSASIMLTTYQHPFMTDFLLPAGRLREARSGARRADIIIVTKCPENISGAEQVKYREQIRSYSDAEVFFMTTVYHQPKPMFENDIPLKRNVVGISGLAHSGSFERHLQKHFGVKLTHHYRDHYRYKNQDVKDIIQELDDDTSLVTTEKDMVKLRHFDALQRFSCFYIPIEMKFIKDEALFLSTMESKLKNYVDDPN
ncbi:lipid-A-disaccharide kinase [Marinoscillum furvescens DSM 4134]|uniref:Tetraacyldisaccharide 4'-kinase n=2 Tax=Marinoscillum furvescens TaxID=1026 RepID=A0A3D9L0W9_MARFU|nr:lipid-A-disaccharide kinase [Marinoscillum furvescens DSM 4134]